MIDQKKYPNLRNYVRYSLPKVSGIPIIANALLKNGEIKKRNLGAVLAWGSQPLVTVSFMIKNQCGEFTPNTHSNEIRISSALANKFEQSGGTKTTTLLIGATILHELAHWGDDQDGKDIAGEEGNLFESAAYGHLIPCII